MAQTAGILTEKLDTLLPSGGMYKKFGEEFESCGYNAKSKVSDALEQYSEVKTYVDNIWYAVCYASGMAGHEGSKSEYCHYLYYWMWEKLLGTLAEEKISGAMRKIYEKVKAYDNRFQCTDMYPSISIELPKKMKKLYDYTRDYDTIKQQLTDSGSRCDQLCKNYLDNIHTAFKAMESKCNDGSGEDNSKRYCQDFKSWFGSNQQYKELLEKKCKTGTEAKDAVDMHVEALLPQVSVAREVARSKVEEQSQSPTYIPPSTGERTVAATSSVVALIGLPAAAVFFLYKYNLLPTWIDNQFKGGRNRTRKKRTSDTRRNFDTLTTETSTIAPTEYYNGNSTTLGSTLDSAYE
ncbi:KIR protein, partial [Plasmodium coatneyi]